jgi:hypothetical protein
MSYEALNMWKLRYNYNTKKQYEKAVWYSDKDVSEADNNDDSALPLIDRKETKAGNIFTGDSDGRGL